MDIFQWIFFHETESPDAELHRSCIFPAREHEDKADYIYNTCLSIPSSTNITDEQLERVVHEIKKALT